MSGTPKNIQSRQDLVDSGLQVGDRIHLGVCGNHVSEDARYDGPVFSTRGDVEEIILDRATMRGEISRYCTGIRARIGKHETELDWGDIVELWPV